MSSEDLHGCETVDVFTVYLDGILLLMFYLIITIHLVLMLNVKESVLSQKKSYMDVFDRGRPESALEG